jgi:nucleoside diphosphate kinase
MVHVDAKLAHDHYEGIGTLISRWGQDVFTINAEYMMSGPVMAFVFE